MALIKVAGKICGDMIVDDADAERCRQFRWFGSSNSAGTVYLRARMPGHKNAVPIHRWLLDAPPGMKVDHINGNTWDNRRSNLRLCTHAENSRNRRRKSLGATGFKGVNRDPRPNYTFKPYRARIRFGGQEIHLGYFPSAEKAAAAYDSAAMRLFGEFAATNRALGLI